MRVAHIVPSLEERHGGPSKSVRALANAMVPHVERVELLATGQDTASPTPRTTDRARIRLFPRTTPQFLTRSAALAAYLDQGEFDVFHHHALWLLPLHYAHRAAEKRRVPLVISPRGMLSDWAYDHRRWKKALAERFVHPGALRGAAGWHATSAQEADAIRRRGFSQPVCVAPNGVDLPAEAALTAARTYWLSSHPALAGKRVALFYSRLHRKKRVRELIELWSAEPRADWVLLVVGVPEEFHAAQLQAEVPAGANVIIADGTGVPPPFAVAEVFLLPSHSENFGMVVAEALAAGVPALVTDTTPWEKLEERQAGACVPWSDFPRKLRTVLATPPESLRALGAAGHEWMATDFGWDRTARTLREFYATLVR